MNRKQSDHLMMIIMSMTLLIIIIFSFVKINSVVHGLGVIITKDNSQIVSLSKGGTIEQLFIAEGDFVRKDQVLAEISNLDLKKEFDRNNAQYNSLKKYTRELDSVISQKGRASDTETVKLTDKNIISNIQLVKSQIGTKEVRITGLSSDIDGLLINKINKKSELGLVQEEVDILSPLVKKGISSYTNLLDKKQAAVRLKSEIADIDNQISAKKSESLLVKSEIEDADFELRHLLSKDLSDSLKELEMSESTLHVLSQQVKETKVKSPVNGVIYKINKSASTRGGVIQAADSLFEIKPLSTIVLAEVKVQPKDRDQIYVGGDVNVNVLSFIRSGGKPYQGNIEQISPDSYEESVNGSMVRYYKIIVKFKISSTDLTQVKPGMTVDASVITGKHSILQYLASPLLKGLNQSFSEPVFLDHHQNTNILIK